MKHMIFYLTLQYIFIILLLGGLHGIESEYAEISLSLKFSLGKIVSACSLVRLYSHMSHKQSLVCFVKSINFNWNILSIHDAMKAPNIRVINKFHILHSIPKILKPDTFSANRIIHWHKRASKHKHKFVICIRNSIFLDAIVSCFQFQLEMHQISNT